MLGFKLNRVSKRGHWTLNIIILDEVGNTILYQRKTELSIYILLQNY